MSSYFWCCWSPPRSFSTTGRVTNDQVTVPGGSDIDPGVLRIERSYETRGPPEKVTSYDATSGGDVVNQVELEYNEVGSPVTEYQEHGGAVNTSTSPKVEYAYDETTDGSGELTYGLRPTSISYPNGRKVRFEYGSGDDDALGRIYYLADDVGGSIGTHLAEYSRLGLEQVVKVDYTEPDLLFDLDHGAAGSYAGLDRFGRIVDLRWRKFPGGGSVVRINHGYDRASNRLWREDVAAADAGQDLDELYSYDGVNQLGTLDRGDLAGDKQSISNKSFAQKWTTLDALGNWRQYQQDDDGVGGWDTLHLRAHSKANEITGIMSWPTDWADPEHDRAGNTTKLPQPNSPAESYTTTYDGWNRLVKVVDDTTGKTVAEYEYDGLNRRTLKRVEPTLSSSSSSSSSGGPWYETRHFYYSTGWQVLEERLDDSADADRQFIWGLRYIDDLILRDRDTTGNGTLNERLYALQDANWNVVALSDTSGTIQERYIYAAVSVPRNTGGGGRVWGPVKSGRAGWPRAARQAGFQRCGSRLRRSSSAASGSMAGSRVRMSR